MKFHDPERFGELAWALKENKSKQKFERPTFHIPLFDFQTDLLEEIICFVVFYINPFGINILNYFSIDNHFAQRCSSKR